MIILVLSLEKSRVLEGKPEIPRRPEAWEEDEVMEKLKAWLGSIAGLPLHFSSQGAYK